MQSEGRLPFVVDLTSELTSKDLELVLMSQWRRWVSHKLVGGKVSMLGG